MLAWEATSSRSESNPGAPPLVVEGDGTCAARVHVAGHCAGGNES